MGKHLANFFTLITHQNAPHHKQPNHHLGQTQQSRTAQRHKPEHRTQNTARQYDKLGMAEYQAIEVFVRMN